MSFRRKLFALALLFGFVPMAQGQGFKPCGVCAGNSTFNGNLTVNGSGTFAGGVSAWWFNATAGYYTSAKLPTPTASTFGTCTGTLTATTTYYYRVSATNAVGETLAFTEVSKATGSTGGTRGIQVNWTTVTGATGYNIYARSTGAELLLASVGTGVGTYCDSGSLVPAGALPTVNTTGNSYVDGTLSGASGGNLWAVGDPLSAGSSYMYLTGTASRTANNYTLKGDGTDAIVNAGGAGGTIYFASGNNQSGKITSSSIMSANEFDSLSPSQALTLKTTMTAGAGPAMVFDTTNAITGNVWEGRVGGVAKWDIDSNGGAVFTSMAVGSGGVYAYPGNIGMAFRGGATTGSATATAGANQFGNLSSLTTVTDNIAVFYSDSFSTVKSYITKDGSMVGSTPGSIGWGIGDPTNAFGSPYAALWLDSGGSYGTTNYILLSDGAAAYVNAPSTTLNLRTGNSDRVSITSTAVTAASSVLFHSSTSKAQTFGSWAANQISGVAATETTNFSGQFKTTSAVAFRNVTCDWTVSGVGGTTGVVARIWDVTNSQAICTCTLGACTTAAGTSLSCDCNQLAAAATVYAVQLASTTDCATNPVNVVCNVEMTQ